MLPVLPETSRGASASILDMLHSAMIAAASYTYFVSHFGEMDVTDRVFWYPSVDCAFASTALRDICCRTIGVSCLLPSKYHGVLTVRVGVDSIDGT